LRIVIISDIHSNLDALETVLKKLPSHDALICLGDIVGYGAQPNEVVERIQGLNPLVALMGNHDYAVVTGDTAGFSQHAAEAVEWTRKHIKEDNCRYLSSLQPSKKIELDGVQVGLFHGSPHDPLFEYIYPGIRKAELEQLIQKAGTQLVLLGHTHVPMIYSVEEKMLANPGSVGQPRDGDPRASFALLTISDNRPSAEVERIQYDIDSAANEIIDAGLPHFLADRLYIGM
jgi:putative phosphoesterase